MRVSPAHSYVSYCSSASTAASWAAPRCPRRAVVDAGAADAPLPFLQRPSSVEQPAPRPSQPPRHPPSRHAVQHADAPLALAGEALVDVIVDGGEVADGQDEVADEAHGGRRARGGRLRNRGRRGLALALARARRPAAPLGRRRCGRRPCSGRLAAVRPRRGGRRARLGRRRRRRRCRRRGRRAHRQRHGPHRRRVAACGPLQPPLPDLVQQLPPPRAPHPPGTPSAVAH